MSWADFSSYQPPTQETFVNKSNKVNALPTFPQHLFIFVSYIHIITIYKQKRHKIY